MRAGERDARRRRRGAIDAQIAIQHGGRGEGDIGDAGTDRPAVSRCQDTSLTPTIGISRYDGLNPATPQNAAGRITDPAVCVPNVIGTKPAATAAAEPADEPPGV